MTAQQVESPRDDLTGHELAQRYMLRAKLGEGGMGTVYRAEHIELSRPVAIKVLHLAYSRNPELVQRFRQEARAASRIGHPNIVEVTDFGHTDDGRVFFVMELLSGEDLADLIEKRPTLDVEEAVSIVLQICDAVHTAHGEGIIHRDLKPENIFLTKTKGAFHVKILDFGVAVNLELTKDGTRITTPGMAMGTPEYMAPEQAEGQIDLRADIYACGVMLYEMLTGKMPHTGETLLALLRSKADDAPAPPTDHRPSLPAKLEAVILKALSTKPDERYQTMADLAKGLRDALSIRADATRPVVHTEAPGSVEEFDPTLAADSVNVDPENVRLSEQVISLEKHAFDMRPGLANTEPALFTIDPPDPKGKRIFWVIGGVLALVAVGIVIWVQSRDEEQPADNKPKQQLTQKEAHQLLDWAKRAAKAGRIVAPRGDNALELLTRVDRQFPKHPAVAQFRKQLCQQLNKGARQKLAHSRFRSARKEAEKCTRFIDKHKEALELIAATYAGEGRRSYKKKKYKDALRSAEKALKISPKRLDAMILAGDAAARVGKNKQARRYYTRAKRRSESETQRKRLSAKLKSLGK